MAQAPATGILIAGAKPFVPTDIAGLKLWLDATDESSFVLSGSSVAQWNDKSGVGNNVSNAVSSSQPVIVAGAQNGKTAVRFVVPDLSSGVLTNVSPINLGGVDSFTVFAVNMNRSLSGNDFMVALYPRAGNNSWRLIKPNASQGRVFTTTANGTTASGVNAVTAGLINVWTLTYGTVQCLGDQSLVNFGTSDTDPAPAEGCPIFDSTGPFAVGFDGNGGVTSYWDGDIGEILFYTPALSQGAINIVANYLRIKWQVQ